MKRNTTIILIILFSFLGFNSCENALILDEEVFSQLDPGSLFTTANGIERVLFGAYADAQVSSGLGNNVSWLEEWTTDVGWETGGGANRHATLSINFTWDASNPTHFSH